MNATEKLILQNIIVPFAVVLIAAMSAIFALSHKYEKLEAEYQKLDSAYSKCVIDRITEGTP